MKKMNKFLKLNLLLLSAMIMFSCSGKNEIEDLKVYAVKYGSSSYPAKYVFASRGGGSVNFGWMCYLVQYNGKNILIDAGFTDENKIRQFGLKYKSPVELLKELKVNPEDIDEIIVTHAHFDHVDGILQFPEAKISIQKWEMEEANKNPELKKFMDKKKSDGDLNVFVNDYRIDDVVVVQRISGHSKGSCSVKIANRKQIIFLPGDEVYIDNNYRYNSVTGTYYDYNRAKEYTQELYKLSLVPGIKIYPFHEDTIVKGNFGTKLLFDYNTFKSVIDK